MGPVEPCEYPVECGAALDPDGVLDVPPSPATAAESSPGMVTLLFEWVRCGNPTIG
jgi:hypothetical protein